MQSKQYTIRALLRERGIDGAIVTSPENFHYVTGFAGHQHTVSRQPFFTLAALPASDETPGAAITMDFELPTFRQKAGEFRTLSYDTWVGVRQWTELRDGLDAPPQGAFRTALDMLTQTVEEMGFAEKRIGIELDFLPVNCYAQLSARFPHAQFVDISELFVLARSVKTPEEIALFRSLCTVADNAFTRVYESVRVGVTEQELSETFKREVTASGVCIPSAWSMFSTGANAARLTLPADGVVRDGDVVKFDAGVNAAFDFYTTDTSRAWVVGNADPTLVRLKTRLYDAQRRMLAAAKPGLPINELFRIGFSHVQAAFPSYRRGHLGHSISMGPATAEAPYINAATTRPLEAGMVLAMEVPCYIDGFAGFNIEDMVLITETGCEVLTPNTPHFLATER